MDTVTSISTVLLQIAIEIESIDSQISQLQFKKDALKDKQNALKKRLAVLESGTNFDNWKLGQQMTLNLLHDELGEVLDI